MYKYSVVKISFVKILFNANRLSLYKYTHQFAVCRLHHFSFQLHLLVCFFSSQTVLSERITDINALHGRTEPVSDIPL